MQKSKLTNLTRALMALIIMPSFVFCSNQAQSSISNNNETINELFDADVDITITAILRKRNFLKDLKQQFTPTKQN